MTATESRLTTLDKSKNGGRTKTVPNPLQNLGFCYMCGVLVAKGTGWTLKVISCASRLICENCK